ncbi:MAG: NAD(P)H-dependent oxidoreductase [Gammaproteobacteria bacterium]
MSTLLYIEASPRKARSHSIKVADAFLDDYAAAHPDDTIDRLDLWDTDLPRFDGDMLNAKYALMHGGQPSSIEQQAWAGVENLFARFGAADKYLFSVPMWNFGLPYVLKHYIDVITQPGLAWSFSPENGYSGLVKGKVTVIYASGGAYHAGSGAEAFDLQKPALENWLGFIGLTDISRIVCAPMLAGPDEVAAAERQAVDEARAAAAIF